ncbi:MAG TPA: hypothetical protein VFC93_15040 [Chloroflexota bacterium]|nr:hypothetical protein [Chloroflexota bacterium]
MEYGWADSAPSRLRSRLPNLNLLPAELLPAPLPWLTAGLVLLGLGMVMLLYALFYMRSYTDLEIAAYRGRLAASQDAARQLGIPIDAVGPDGQLALPPGLLEDWAELKAREINWPALLGAIAGAAARVNVSGVTQTGYTLSIAGDAASSADANDFLQKLRDSGLFASLDMSIAGEEAQPTAATTPAPQATAPAAPTVGAPPAVATPLPTIPPPPPTPPGGFPPTAAPAPQPTSPPRPTATLAPRTPLATPTPLGAPPTAAATQAPAGSPTVAPTNTPAYDFVVLSKRETVDPNAIGNNSSIRIRVVDANGNLVPGLRAHIDSQGQPAWSAELPRSGDRASDGTFSFAVGMGKFTVYIANGYSERATDLFTGVQGQPGVHVWDVTFRKTIAGTPASGPTCPGCTPVPPTPTNTPVPPTATPISYGNNVAGFACVTGSRNNGDAARAVDGDTNTAWDSGAGPVQQITLDFQRYASFDARRSCQPVGGSDPTSYLIEAVELVPLMSGPSKQTIELWALFDDNTSALLNTFTDVDTNDGQTISYRLSTPRQIRTIVVRTVRSGVNVGWREIRLYSPLPPAIGTWTSTPTVTPTFGNITPTPSPISGSTVRPGQCQASSDNNGNNPCTFAYDVDPALATFWRPIAGLSGQYAELDFLTPQAVAGVRFVMAMGASANTPTATPGGGTPTPTPYPASVSVQMQAGAGFFSCFVAAASYDYQVLQGDCGTVQNVSAVRLVVDSSNTAFAAGIRDTTIYVGTATPTPTPMATAGSPTAISTPSATATPTPTLTDVARGSKNVLASSWAANHDPSLATDAGTGSGDQDATTYWQASQPPAPSESEWWLVQFTYSVAVEEVRFTVFLPTPASGTITVQLINSQGTPIATPTPTPNPTGTLTATPIPTATQPVKDGQLVDNKYPAAIPDVAQVRISFTGFPVAPGLHTVSVFARGPAAAAAAAASARTLTATRSPTATPTPTPSATIRPTDTSTPLGGHLVPRPTSARAQGGVLDDVRVWLEHVFQPNEVYAASDIQQPTPPYPGPGAPPQGPPPLATPTPPLPPSAGQNPFGTPPAPPAGPAARPGAPASQPAAVGPPPPVGLPTITPSAVPPPAQNLPPPAQAGPPGGQPAPTLAAAGQRAANPPSPIPLTGNPFPGSAPAAAAPAAAGAAPPPAPPPRGRVSFLIIAQVRPGA